MEEVVGETFQEDFYVFCDLDQCTCEEEEKFAEECNNVKNYNLEEMEKAVVAFVEDDLDAIKRREIQFSCGGTSILEPRKKWWNK